MVTGIAISNDLAEFQINVMEFGKEAYEKYFNQVFVGKEKELFNRIPRLAIYSKSFEIIWGRTLT